MPLTTRTPALLLLLVLLGGCRSGPRLDLPLGNLEGIKEVNELAITCRTDEALATLDRIEQAGGLGANIAQLQRVVLLRDADRFAEADAALAARNDSPWVDAQNKVDAEASIQQALQDLRDEREKRTGRRTCE